MPRLPIGFQFVTHGLSPVPFAASYVFSKLFKPSIVMISNVGEGLTQPLGNLSERVAFKEVEPERLFLVLGQLRGNLFPPVPAKAPFDGMVVVCSLIAGLPTFNRSVRISGQIEPAGL